MGASDKNGNHSQARTEQELNGCARRCLAMPRGSNSRYAFRGLEDSHGSFPHRGHHGGFPQREKEWWIQNVLARDISQDGRVGYQGWCAAGGVCQVSVMGPCTFMVTALVTGSAKGGVMQFASKTWAEKGIKGFYPGGSAIAFRQATNWASRQGFTDAVRSVMLTATGGNGQGKLTVGQEVFSGMLGGMLACWNHPFEVARIEMQARAAAGESKKSMVTVLRDVRKEAGMQGLFQCVIPRIGLGIWQTLFMVTGANLVRDAMSGN